MTTLFIGDDLVPTLQRGNASPETVSPGAVFLIPIAGWFVQPAFVSMRFQRKRYLR